MTSDHLLSLIKLPVATAAGLLLFSLCVKADIPNDPFYCGERKLGFFFYCTKAGNTVKEEKQVAPPSTASERIRDIGAQLEDMRATAILDPTTENIAAYIRFQREQLDRASLFADMWQRTLWQQPELDYTLVRPVGHLSKKVWSDERVREQEALFASLGERYGIFYVYAGSCAACQAFSPLLRGFADRYGLTVKAVSVDGAPNEYFPGAVMDGGQVTALGLTDQPVPAVILFDASNHTATPVGFGLISEQQLRERIYILTQKGAGDDY